MSRKIFLTKGQHTIVDDDDYRELSGYKWRVVSGHYGGRYYAMRGDEGVLMHRTIMGNPTGLQIDHINHDTLDNRKSNLRTCTHAENQRNVPKQKNNTSGLKGVGWYKRDRRWRAKIKYEGKTIHLGYFDTKKEAGQAYNDASIKYHGEFGFLNQIKE